MFGDSFVDILCEECAGGTEFSKMGTFVYSTKGRRPGHSEVLSLILSSNNHSITCYQDSIYSGEVYL